MNAPRMDEIGFYALAGAPESPRELIGEVQRAEQLGIGTAFLSERFNIKEAATLSGAAGAVSSAIQIATAATNHNTRHPIVTASYATTMHRLTGGRFTLGIGRGIRPLSSGAFGIPPITTAQMEDFALPDAPALARRDGHRPRRPLRPLAGAAPRPELRRGHPARRSSRSARTRSPSAAASSTP